MTLVVNLLSGPGAGKSTTAAGVFHHLKMAGVNVELVTEYAKDLTWEKRHAALENQNYVFAKQTMRLARVNGQVDVVITDSCLLFSLIYAQNYPVCFDEFVLYTFNQFTNMNYFVERKKAYVQAGRNQTEAEAKEIDAAILAMLDRHAVPFTKVMGAADAVDTIVGEVMARLRG